MEIKPINYTSKSSFKNSSKIMPYINQERLQDSFIKMAKIDTGSLESAKVSNAPSTKTQIDFAKILKAELEDLGLVDIELDENGILMGTYKGNIGKNSPVIGLIAHLDTSEQAPSANIKPQIHDYKEGDITLSDGIKINEEDLLPYKNTKIITSDGTTLLGADDKAGIAEILEALRVFKENPQLKCPTIRIAFTPDEETGLGIEGFDIKKFRADVAYTVDGLQSNTIDTETFNAYDAQIIIDGIQVHPGYAYNKMINSITIANEIISQLPKDETPEATKGKDGYYHVANIEGSASKTKIDLIIRDFNLESAKKRVDFIKSITEHVQKKYPKAKIDFNSAERYLNMKEYLKDFPEAIEIACEGIKKTGLEVKETSVRGGTDGSHLTLSGLPTPNLGAGGVNFHSIREFISMDEMVKCTQNIINIVNLWGEKAKDVMPKILERRNKNY